MANPLIVDCTKNSWTEIATDVTAGLVHVDLPFLEIVWYQTYRLTGEASPADLTDEDGAVKLLKPTDVINASEAIDVYVWPRHEDGKIRVDL